MTTTQIQLSPQEFSECDLQLRLYSSSSPAGSSAHPLLIRNTLVYQSPTFNVNTYFLYMDEFPDEPAIQAKLAASHSLPEVIQTYWEKHTFEELLKREVHGIGWGHFVSFDPSAPVRLTIAGSCLPYRCSFF